MKIKTDYRVVEAHLKNLGYVTVDSRMRTWFGGSVVGFNLSATSLIRKSYTMKRIQREIKKRNLPLILDDRLGEDYRSFQVLLTIEPMPPD